MKMRWRDAMLRALTLGCLLPALQALAAPCEPACASALEYPDSRPGQTIDDYHGIRVLDPYRWLEADIRNTPEIRSWVDAQNALSRRYLDGLPQRKAIHARLEALSNIEAESAPRFAGPWQVYLRRGVGEEQYSLWARAGDDGAPRRLVDPARLRADGTAALAGFEVERSGRYLAYVVQEAGSDWRTWHVLDIASGRTLDDRVAWNKFSGVSWDPRGKGFYYTRFPEPQTSEQYLAANRGIGLYYHRVGTAQSRDRLVYRNDAHPDYLFAGALSGDGRHLLVSSGYVGGGPQLLYRKGRRFVSLFPPTDNSLLSYRFIDADGDVLYFITNADAPNGRLIALDLRHREQAPATVIAEADSPLLSVVRVGSRFVASYLQDAKARIRIYDARGNASGEVPLPGPGSIQSLGAGPDGHSLYYQFSGFATPPTLYRHDLATAQTSLLRASPAPVVPADYRTEQVFFTARDGKRIPMFLAYRKERVRNSDTPVLLYGYGGFGLSFPPDFRPEQVAWMDMGGMFAFPVLPGGGEYGEAWHRAGMLQNKPAVFDAFIDAAGYLIDQGYTQPRRLAIFGYSNGGLLVGAAMTRRPDLFAVALPTVGVLDMLRFPHFTNGALWAVEFGSPDDPKMFPVLRGYSPYHNIVPGRRYPATLVTTGDTDDRVYPAHSFKFAARLQAEAAPGSPVLLSVEANAGHGAGTRRSQVIDSAADRLAFTLQQLGMTLPPAFPVGESAVPEGGFIGP